MHARAFSLSRGSAIGVRARQRRFGGAPSLVLRGALVVALIAAVAAGGWRTSGGESMAASRAIIEQSNAARAQAGLPPLATDARLTLAAEAYSREMARDGWFGHTARDGAGVEARAEAAGYTEWEYLGENLATGAGRPDAGAVVERWLESADHRRNILAPELREVGVACYSRGGRYWCAQEFGARIPQPALKKPVIRRCRQAMQPLVRPARRGLS